MSQTNRLGYIHTQNLIFGYPDFEISDPSPTEIARMFFTKLLHKGLVPAEGLTVNYVSQLIQHNTKEDWRAERNGYIAELLLNAVRAELKSKIVGGEAFSRESVSPRKLLPQPGQKLPVNAVEEILVTSEDVQNAVINGL